MTYPKVLFCIVKKSGRPTCSWALQSESMAMWNPGRPSQFLTHAVAHPQQRATGGSQGSKWVTPLTEGRPLRQQSSDWV